MKLTLHLRNAYKGFDGGNTDILIILWKLIINFTTFMFSLCIFIIDIDSGVEIMIVFWKFGVDVCMCSYCTERNV